MKFKGTSPAQQKKKVPVFSNSHQRDPLFFPKPQKGAKITVLRFLKKTKSKAISLKSHIRGRNPLYRLKPGYGKKVVEVQRRQPGPAKKKVPVFANSHQRNPPFFPKAQKSAKITVLRFFLKKNTKKTSPKKKYKKGPDAFTDAYRSVLKSPYKKKTFCCVAQISFFYAFWTCGASLTI